MIVHFLFHSGFLVETDSASLLFDYWRGTLPPLDPEKPLLVFVSHSHPDHYSREIFRLSHPAGLHYILSDEIPPCREMEGKCCHRMKPHEILSLPLPRTDCEIRTLRSNDLGVAFLLRLGTEQLYHAGDLNNWWWDGDAEDQALERQYRGELSRIRGTHFRLAFVPLDPRLRSPEKGILDFLDYACTDCLVPMHFSADPSVIERFLAMPAFAELSRRTRFLPLREGGTAEV